MDDLNLVLLIEDDPQDVTLVRRFLDQARRHRFLVRQISRLDGLAVALQTTAPDVLVCDLTLPDAIGLEAVQAAMRLAPDTPLIVLTGVEDEALGLEAMRYGAQDYLVKGQCDAQGLERAIVYAIERKRLMRQLEHAAMYDALTGLPNRSLVLDRLRMATARCQRSREALWVVWIDVDDFEAVNSDMGRASGDVLLALIGHRLLEAVHPAETVARIGGDEFVCVLEDGPGGRAVIDAMVEQLIEPYRVFSAEHPDGRAVEVRASVGVARFPDDGDSAERLLVAAEHTMCTARRLGGGRVIHAADVDSSARGT